MRKVVAILWIALLLGALVVTPRKVNAGDTGGYWVKGYNGIIIEHITGVNVLPDGSIIVVGRTTLSEDGDRDTLVMKFSSDGKLEWAKTYGGSNDDMAHTVAIASNGDIIVAGEYGAIWNSSGRYWTKAHAWVLRLDENGNVKWQKTYSGSDYDSAFAVAIAPDGDIIVAGWTSSFGAGDWDAWVLRLDENGNVKWQKTYGGDSWDEARAIAIASNGDIIIAGKTESFGAGDGDFWVLRLDENGNVKWQKTYGESGNDRAFAVAIAPDGDIIVAGWTSSFGAGDWDAWVLRLDENGNVKWQKTYGESGNDRAFAVAIAPNGDIIVVGTNLMSLSPDGELKWAVELGGSDIKILPDGTTVLAGSIIARFNIDEVPQYSDWSGWDEVSLEVHESNAQVQSTNAKVEASNAEIHDTNAEVHDANVELKTLWTYTPPKATLEISSEPSGAEVYINGDYKGETPVTLELEAGSYTVKITKEGYEDYTTTIEVNAGETKEITAQLKEKSTTTHVEATSTLLNTGTIEVPGYQPSNDYLKKTAEYAINKAEELIGKVKNLGYEINFADDYLREAKKAFDAGDYKKAKELALNAWITAFQEWQIQYESEILEKAGVDVSQVIEKYNSGDLDGAIELIHSLENELSGDYAEVFDSVDDTFESVKDYWDEGIRLWNYVDDLYSSNEKFKSDELDVAKNLADKALNVVRDVGEIARDVLRQLKELGNSIFREGRGDEKAKELFERAMELFERGEFEQAKQVVVEIQEVVTVTTTKSGGICGPALILGLMIIPILIRRKLM